MILLNFGWMVDLAMGIFEFLTNFLVFWHPWHPWVCIRSVCRKWNLKQIEAIPPIVHFINNCFYTTKMSLTQPRIKIKLVFGCIFNWRQVQVTKRFLYNDKMCKWQSCGLSSFARIEKKAAIQLVPLNFFPTGAVCVSKLVKYVQNVCFLMVYLLERLPTFQTSRYV